MPTDRPPFTLASPYLELGSDALHDIENVRKAAENRLRQACGTGTDSDGERRQLAILEQDHSDATPEGREAVASVERLADMVADLNCKSKVLADLGRTRPPKQRGVTCCLEHAAEENLTRLLRQHPLGQWIMNTHGIGMKQGARMLAAIGDPYIRPEMTRVRADGTVVVEPSRPRKRGELRQYVGFGDAATQVRRRGVKARWNAKAKTRVWLVADKIVMVGGPYREDYDVAREKYADAVHKEDCVRCGPSGHPALAGSPLSDGHKHARGKRAVAKAVLNDLWRESKRLHELHEPPGDHAVSDIQGPSVAGAPTSSGDHTGSDIQDISVAGGPFTLGREAFAKLDSDLERVRAVDENSGGGVSFYGKFLASDEHTERKAYLTKRTRIAVVDACNVRLRDYDTFEEFAEEHSDTPRFVSDVANRLGGQEPRDDTPSTTKREL